MEKTQAKKRRPKWVKRLIIAFLTLAVAGLFFYGGVVVFVGRAEKNVAAPTDDYGAILVLGAQVKAWGEPSLALLRRMELALKHYQQTGKLIICCGAQGQDEPVAEGDFMRAWMIERGVPEDLVISENQSYNTRQNIANAKVILDERAISKVLVVTSDYHVARALATCRGVGLDATGDGSLSQPEMMWQNRLREALSWIKFGIGL